MGQQRPEEPAGRSNRYVALSTCRFFVYLLTAALVLGVPGRASAGGPAELTCESCLVVDGMNRTLWSRLPAVVQPNASTTKMVTALIVVRRAELDEEVVVSSYAAATGGGGLDLLTGDSYSVEALLYALLLSSSNDASVALAEHVSGTESEFVAAMNRWVSRAGLEGTTFVTPHGLDTPGHGSTASDLAVIGQRVLEQPVLAEIVATPQTTISGPNGSVLVENRNLLLESYRGAIGIKTGMTLGAGEVLVAAARRGGRLVIAVAMRSLNAASDATALLDFGFKRLRRELVLEKGEVMGELVLDPAGSVTVTLGRTIRVFAPKKRVDYVKEVDESLPASIEPGDRVGTMRIVIGKRTLATAPLLAGERVDPPTTSFFLGLLEAILGFVSVTGRALGLG
ncbi:MAG TPA: serine hydrolase [Actinomycetota bacterium]|nr:serine hydrolase [Actinomycetota bacterium]